MAITKTTRLNLAKQAEGDLDWEVGLNTGQDDADARFFLEGAGSPAGVVTADYIYQRYIDTSTGTIKRWWTAIDTASPSTWQMEQAVNVAPADGASFKNSLGVDQGAVVAYNDSLFTIDSGGSSIHNLIKLKTGDELEVGDDAIVGLARIWSNAATDLFHAFGSGDKKIWTEANDGVGSLLDADLVQGFDYALAANFDHTGTKGHQKFPGGLMLTWEREVAVAGSGSAAGTWSTTFSALFGAFITGEDGTIPSGDAKGESVVATTAGYTLHNGTQDTRDFWVLGIGLA